MRHEEEREFHSDRRARVEVREEEGRAGSRGGEEGRRRRSMRMEGGKEWERVTIMIWREYELRSD